MPRGRRIPIPLPNTGGALLRKRNTICFRTVLVFFLVGCAVMQVYILTSDEPNKDGRSGGRMSGGSGSGGSYSEVQAAALQVNDSVAAILQNVPPGLHKYLTKPKNNATRGSGDSHNNSTESGVPPIEEITRQIYRYNDQQLILNDETFGPLLNDSVIIVIQVHKRITYLRHLIVSLAQARDISKAMLIFSHDFYHEEINELVQSVDFCKVMQIYYPYSIQTHPHEFPGEDPNDCDRNMKKEQAEIRRCNSYQYPDLYGHYREAKFTQTKHHWWWKANRVFDELEVTRSHSGPVIFLEEDHYVAEDFLYVLSRMRDKARTVCAKCNILSLGTYLKTFNYYSYNVNKNVPKRISPANGYQRAVKVDATREKEAQAEIVANSNRNAAAAAEVAAKSLGKKPPSNGGAGGAGEGMLNQDRGEHYLKSVDIDRKMLRDSGGGGGGKGKDTAAATTTTTEKYPMQWGYQILPTLYSVYQKVEITPWISSKHNMGMVFNKTTWQEIVSCSKHFCSYDDYNWDWSLQHVSQQCLKHKLHVMVLKGPRVFHIGECGVHHKKKNCESNHVISKVQKVLQVVSRSNQLYPKSLKVVMASVQNKNTKLRKGNGGWGDKRDHSHCMNVTMTNRYP